MRESHHRATGFTLIELMMVVTVIAIVIAIALPGIGNARMAANEASAISSMRALFTSNIQYRTRFGAYAAAMNDLFTQGYIDPSIADPDKAGYTFTYTSGATDFSFNGDPRDPGISGERYFFVDSSGVIRFNEAAQATRFDSAIAP